MGARICLDVGSVFGRLTVKENLPTENGRSVVLAECSCGNHLKVKTRGLVSGKTKSCGCLKRDRLLEVNTKHGMAGTRFYKIWRHMKERCDSPKSQYYNDYGGRGISYEPKWSDFVVFMEDMYNGYNDSLELDRIDPNGNYCKDNCQWATESHQAFNQRKRKTNTSGRTGVYQKKDGKYWAEIQNNGNTEWIGTFLTFEEAVKVREDKELEYYGFVKG